MSDDSDSDGEWNEDKYNMHDEAERSLAHDCIGDRKNCDTIHPNFINISNGADFNCVPLFWF